MRKPELIEMRRAQVVRDRAHFFERLRDGVAELIELRPRLVRPARSSHCSMRAVFDDQQILAQAVVQFGGDAFALSLLRFDQLAREGLLRGLPPFELRDAVFESGQRLRRSTASARKRQKPPGAIKRRQHDNAADVAPLLFQTPSLLAAITLERVIARRHMRKIGRAPRPGFNPIVVESFELVFETQIFRIDKRQRGVADLKILLIRID